MTDAEVRAAYLRVADPAGSAARLAYLVVAFGCIGTYGVLQLRGMVRDIVPFATLAGALYYIVNNIVARRVARRASEAEVRDRFLRKAKASLALAHTLPLRSLVWLGLGGWAWTCLIRGMEFPLSNTREMTIFVGGIGTLLGARYLYEWRVEIPALRRDLANLTPPPTP